MITENNNPLQQKSSCPFGQYSQDMCAPARNLLDQALNGNDSELILSAKEQFSSCLTCQNILDHQLKLRETMASHLKLSAPKQLRIDISANLKRMDLGKLDISDFFPPNPNK